MQKINTIFVVVIVIALGALGAASYFYMQYSELQSEAKSLNQQLLRVQDEKTKIETELAVLKATDLAKENEILQLKLKTAEKDLATEKEFFAQFRNQVKTIPQLVDALSLIVELVYADNVSQCPKQFGRFGEVRQKILALGDTRLLNAWDEFAKSPDPDHCGIVPRDFQRVMNLGLDKISGSIK